LQANEIAAELEWLCMLAGQVSFPIPAPVAARDGASVVTRRLDQGTSLHWTMLRWVPGRQYRRGIRDIHLERAGEMTAELHAITRRMECPVLPRPRWDARQLHAAVEELRPHFAAGALPPHIWDLVLEAERGCVALMAQPSTASQFGLIHADLGVQNFVFRGGQVSPIDFCSCGYGYFAFDIAQILLPAPRQSYWEAFLRAYARAGGSGVDEAAVRQFSGMSFILWLNFNIPTRFRGIEMRLESRALRMRELLPR
jgi:Ser/Thr protein kinase RdoA (MazF antagonist)